jgi:hypothetical protein
MPENNIARLAAALIATAFFGLISGSAVAATRVEGQVQIGGGAVSGSTVTLWAASADAPAQLAQAKTDANGRFVLSVAQTPSGVPTFYLVGSGGTPAVNKAGGNNPAIGLLAVLGAPPPPAKVIVNELTTVASAFTAARFIKGEAISGNPLGLRIASGNVPNLVDPATGGWGKVLP